MEYKTKKDFDTSKYSFDKKESTELPEMVRGYQSPKGIVRKVSFFT